MIERAKTMTKLGIQQFSDPYYQGFAAQIAFFMMLSLTPTLIVLSQLLGFLDISLDTLYDIASKYVIPETALLLGNLLTIKSATTVNIVLVITALWAASRAQFAIKRFANYTYSSGKTTGGFWKERLRSIETMVITVFTLAFVVVISVYGKGIFEVIAGRLLDDTIITMVWRILRWPAAFTLYFFMVTYIYFMISYDQMNIKDILPGSVFGSVSMLGITIVYSLYTNYAVNYDVIYGSLSNIVALMFWFYFLSWALCLGILINKVWKDTK